MDTRPGYATVTKLAATDLNVKAWLRSVQDLICALRAKNRQLRDENEKLRLALAEMLAGLPT